jgi:hypothetical protein
VKNVWIDYGFSDTNLISTARFHNIIDVILRKSKNIVVKHLRVIEPSIVFSKDG